MLCSRVCGLTPRPTDSEPCGSKSTSSTLRPTSASAAPRLIVRGGLADPALLVAHRDDHRGAVGVDRRSVRAGPARAVRSDRSPHRARVPESACARRSASAAGSEQVDQRRRRVTVVGLVHGCLPRSPDPPRRTLVGAAQGPSAAEARSCRWRHVAVGPRVRAVDSCRGFDSPGARREVQSPDRQSARGWEVR